ncbi:isocitrate lyase/PEP mutase family protein [Stenotrophomonas sp. ATs4]|uniref:isocitrate lyase/PEP mutase family protein n=1 Tax=Stenotrophomonas sp. ATs4 TaxID=3402766 RepID=UPI003F7209FD
MSNRYQRFVHLHHQNELLTLPTIWDAASARLAQACGAHAVGTSSAALAWSCGHADGGSLPMRALLQRVAEIVRVTALPVTVDIEDGYSDDPLEVATCVQHLAELGVVGINIEDGDGDPALLAAKIAAVRHILGPRSLFINARTDVYLRGLAHGEAAIRMSVERLQTCARSGADGGFVPGLQLPQDIAALKEQIPLPLNVMWLPGMPSNETLYAAGVRRLSAGPALFMHAWASASTATRALLSGTLAADDMAPDYATFNLMFSSRP